MRPQCGQRSYVINRWWRVTTLYTEISSSWPKRQKYTGNILVQLVQPASSSTQMFESCPDCTLQFKVCRHQLSHNKTSWVQTQLVKRNNSLQRWDLDPTTDAFQGERTLMKKPNEDTCWGKTSILFILLYDDDVTLNRRNKRDGVKVVQCQRAAGHVSKCWSYYF